MNEGQYILVAIIVTMGTIIVAFVNRQGNRSSREHGVTMETALATQAMITDSEQRSIERAERLEAKTLFVADRLEARHFETADRLEKKVVDTAFDLERKTSDGDRRLETKIDAFGGIVDGFGNRLDALGHRIDKNDENIAILLKKRQSRAPKTI